MNNGGYVISTTQVVVLLYQSRYVSELYLLGVGTRNFVRSVTCLLHVQWGLNLVSSSANAFSEVSAVFLELEKI